MTTTPPFEIVNPNGQAPCLLICDHASRTVPGNLKGLGLDDKYFDRHIAWDIGAAAITRRLAVKIDAPAVLCGFSRLVIDPNRRLDEAGLIPEISDNIPIPGNQGLTDLEKSARVDDFYWPYHNAISASLAKIRLGGAVPFIFSVHSFTPLMNGKRRVWDAGVLSNRDRRVAKPLIAYLESHRDTLTIGDNQPYSGKVVANSLDYHGSATGLPHAAVEIRQDLAADEKGVEYWVQILFDALQHLLSIENLRVVEPH